MEPRLKSIYKNQILPELKNSLGVKNTMQVPKIEKIVVNMGLGLDANDNKILKIIETDLANITGQKPVVTKSKKAISNFKTRADIPLGLKVTLRKNNINSEIFLDSKKNLGKQLTYANKRQCPVAVICGENEFKDNKITLKNLLGIKGENNQSTFPKEDLINEIKKYI